MYIISIPVEVQKVKQENTKKNNKSSQQEDLNLKNERKNCLRKFYAYIKIINNKE